MAVSIIIYIHCSFCSYQKPMLPTYPNLTLLFRDPHFAVHFGVLENPFGGVL